MITDPLILVNLACYKHTGCLLPVSYNGSNEWSYELVDGKKKAKYNPYKSTLLRNPFVTAYDTHPIEQQIRRSMIVGEIKHIFKPEIEYIHILMALGGEVGHPLIQDDSVIPWDERRVLQQIGLNYINWLHDDNNLLTHDMVDLARRIEDIDDGDFHEPDGREYCFLKSLNTLVVLNQDRLPKTYEALKDKKNPDDVKEKVKNIHKRLIQKQRNNGGWRNQGASNLYGGATDIDILNRKSYRRQGVLDLDYYSTENQYPKVKRADWWCWFYIYFNNQTSSYNSLPEVHRKRSTTKVNWWEEVKKQSGRYSLSAHKDKKLGYEKRLMESILKQ